MLERYPEYEHLLAALQLALAMAGMGALLRPEEFVHVFRRPRGWVTGLACQLVMVPLLAAALGRALPIEVGVAAGLVLVAAVPGGTLSNVVTYLGRGDIALSIAVTVVTTVGALVTTPLLLRALIGAHLPSGFEMPTGPVAFEIGVTLLAPLAAGMAIGHQLAAPLRERFSRLCIRASLALIALIVIGAGGSGRLDPVAYGASGILAVALLCIGAQLLAGAACRLVGLAPADRLAVVIEVTIRNTNLAILLKASLFPAVVGKADPIGDGMLFVALLYGGVALLVAVPPVLRHRGQVVGGTPGGAE